MIKLFKRLFSSPDTINNTVDAVIKTGDALFFTDEEKSSANLKLLELKIEFAKATTGSRLARRVLAFMFSGTFLALVLTSVGLGLAGMPNQSTFVMETVRDTLATPVAVIIGFYFATQMIRK